MSDTGSEPAPAAPATGEVSKDDKLWGLLCHASSLLGFGIVAPLIILLVKGKDSAFVSDHAKEALNFQITVFAAALVCIPLMFILIGFALIGVVALAALVLAIMAAIKANEGATYRYPFAIRLIK